MDLLVETVEHIVPVITVSSERVMGQVQNWNQVVIALSHLIVWFIFLRVLVSFYLMMHKMKMEILLLDYNQDED